MHELVELKKLAINEDGGTYVKVGKRLRNKTLAGI
jgi:hypothetical protein